MRSVSRRRAADFVRPSLSEARIARMWSSIAEVERARAAAPRKRRSWGVSILAAAALAAALLVGFWRWPRSSPAMAGLLIDTGDATQEVSLPDGSSLHLAAATRLSVRSATAAELRLRLERGGMVCDVVHREDRRFVVEAGGVEVEDRGTRFAVDVISDGAQSAVAVRVERGAVEVHDAARAVLATLKPGQSWRSASPEELPAPEPRRKPPSPEEPPAPPPSPPSSTPAPAAAPPPIVTGSASSAAPSPQVLFERADAARLAGRHAEAAADFDRFYRRFPSDPRAALAAYELGRIRLGSLHDPRGAADAFAAVLERPDGPFREDAEAARVEALADLGDEEACKRARDAFRAHYPRSTQANRVAKLCGP